MTTSRFGRTNRRRFVASSVLGRAAILAAGHFPSLANGAGTPAALAQRKSSDVPMFRGNAARTGEMPGPGPDDSNGVEEIWRFTTDDAIKASPAVVDGVVYVGTVNAYVYALNADDGRERWRSWIRGQIFDSSPAVVDEIVFVGDSYKWLFALNADDGTERWRFATDDGINTSPAVVDGVLYVGSRDGNLCAVNAEDGAERWRLRGIGAYSSPAVVDGVIYGNLYAVNSEDGTERWRFSNGRTSGLSSPAVVDGVVYVGSYDGTLYAVNAEDGTERWRFATDDVIESSPAVVDGVVYVGSYDGTLYAVNAEDGTERWRFTDGGGYYSSPAVVDGVVYVGSEDGNLYAVNIEAGTERWQFATGAGIWSSPAVVDGVVYVGSFDGNLYAIGARVPRLSVGGTARVTETTTLRGGPASTAVERAGLAPDTVVMITGEAETAGDVTWWPVTVDATGDQGWIDASKLEPLTSGPEPTVPA